jgi:hypothetical protein
MKPKRGFARDIYEIVQADGPLAYNGIHERLRKRKVRMSKDQVKRCLINMQQREQLVRSDQNYNKFVVVEITKAVERAQMPDPIQPPSPVEKTPERAQIEPYEALSNAGWRGVALVAAIAAISAALTTIILEYL